MKKKLLITLGCSYIEGEGIYDYSLIEPNTIISDYRPGSDRYDRFVEKNLHNFHTKGIPAKLGKMMGFDKVLNMGYRGSSTSGQLKVLFEKYNKPNFKDYDVTIFWLLTEPCRISFYHDGYVLNFNGGSWGDKLYRAYIQEVSNGVSDCVLEQSFYIKSLEHYCELNNFELYIGHSNPDILKPLKETNDSKNILDMKGSLFFDRKNFTREQFSKICDHPNEFGYELASQEIFDCIQEHTNNKFGPENPNVEIEYNGKPIKHKKNIL